MKPLFTLLQYALLLCAVSSFGQTIRLVDNSPGAPTGPQVFNSLQAAIDASVAGDIIHVKPSATSYGNVTITTANDSISIFGIGFNPDKNIPVTSVIGDIDIQGSNIRVSGLVCSNLDMAHTAGAIAISNILVDNCKITRIDIGNGATRIVTNVIIRNCIVTGSNTIHPYIEANVGSGQIIITNNILGGYTGSTSVADGTIGCASGCIIKNNVFHGDGGPNQNAFENLANSTVNNNIFFGRSPQPSGGTIVSSSFKNNMATGSSNDSFVAPTNGNSVSGTVPAVAVNSVFSDAGIILSKVWDTSWLPELADVSLQGAGTDGTDIGVTGSSIPFAPTGTPLPYIKVFDATEIIKQGDSLNISIQAIGN